MPRFIRSRPMTGELQSGTVENAQLRREWRDQDSLGKQGDVVEGNSGEIVDCEINARYYSYSVCRGSSIIKQDLDLSFPSIQNQPKPKTPSSAPKHHL